MHRQDRLKYLEHLAEARTNFIQEKAETREAELKRLHTEIERRKQMEDYQIAYEAHCFLSRSDL